MQTTTWHKKARDQCLSPAKFPEEYLTYLTQGHVWPGKSRHLQWAALLRVKALRATPRCADSFYAPPNCFCKCNCSPSVKTRGNKFALRWQFLNGEEELASAFNTKRGSTSSSPSVPPRTMGPEQPPALTPLIQLQHLNEKLDRGGGGRRESKGRRSETMSEMHYFRGPSAGIYFVLTLSLLVFLQHTGLLFLDEIGWRELKRTS